eukprot:jgi/Psemu1/23895/gm1.23895_g
MLLAIPSWTSLKESDVWMVSDPTPNWTGQRCRDDQTRGRHKHFNGRPGHSTNMCHTLPGSQKTQSFLFQGKTGDMFPTACKPYLSTSTRPGKVGTKLGVNKSPDNAVLEFTQDAGYIKYGSIFV